MTKSILKPIIGGILFGALVFAFPFFVMRTIAFFVVVGILFRLFSGRRHGGPMRGMGFKMGFADKIRNMSDEEYAQFQERFQNRCGRNFNSQEPVTQTN